MINLKYELCDLDTETIFNYISRFLYWYENCFQAANSNSM